MLQHVKKYAIRHKPTGEFIPVSTGRMGRGGSHVEPRRPIEGVPSSYPRLFDTRKGASNFLAQWLRGKHIPQYDYEVDEWRGKAYKVDAGTKIQSVESRKRDEMEIVVICFHIERD